MQHGHGNVGPFIIGLSLTVAAFTGGPYTGAALNFARFLGPAVVYQCGLKYTYLYLLAGVLAACVVAAWSVLVNGRGPYSPVRHLASRDFPRSTPWSTAHELDEHGPPYARLRSRDPRVVHVAVEP